MAHVVSEVGVGSEAVAPELFGHVLGHFSTGVAVVSAMHQGAPVGLAMGSFFSVSLDPPLVGFCAAKTSKTWPGIKEAGRFGVNVLTADQEALCRQFAASGGFSQIRGFAGSACSARRSPPSNSTSRTPGSSSASPAAPRLGRSTSSPPRHQRDGGAEGRAARVRALLQQCRRAGRPQSIRRETPAGVDRPLGHGEMPEMLALHEQDRKNTWRFRRHSDGLAMDF
jgi:hypothetical protein